MAHTNKLFEGDTSYQLSEQELEQLFKKFNFHPEDIELQQKRLKDSFNILNNTPSGAKILRHFLNNQDETFNVDLRDNANPGGGNHGLYSISSDRVTINPDLWKIPKESENHGKHAAVVFAHECLHDLQKNNTGALSTIATEANDAETQALNFQLANELGVLVKPEELLRKAGMSDIEMFSFIRQTETYNSIYKENHEKWLDIAKNPKKTPEGIQPFKPAPGADKAQAQKAYAAQMAALETQAQFIKDFVNDAHRDPIKDPKTTLFDFNGLNRLYKDENYGLSRLFKDKQIPKDFIDDAIKRNPFLKQEDFNKARLAYGEEPVYSNNTNAVAEQSSGGIASWFKNSWFGRLIGINDEPSQQENTALANNTAKDQPTQNNSSQTQSTQAQAQPAQAQTQAPQEQRAPDARRALAQFKMPEQDNQQQAMAYQKYGGREA